MLVTSAPALPGYPGLPILPGRPYVTEISNLTTTVTIGQKTSISVVYQYSIYSWEKEQRQEDVQART